MKLEAGVPVSYFNSLDVRLKESKVKQKKWVRGKRIGGMEKFIYSIVFFTLLYMYYPLEIISVLMHVHIYKLSICR